MTSLLESPILWLPATIAAYLVAQRLAAWAGKPPIFNPTLLGITAIAAMLLVAGIPYEQYYRGASILHYALGAAVVSLAVPLHRNLRRLRADPVVLSAALLAGVLTSAFVGVAILIALNAGHVVIMSAAPKSATAAVSMEIARGMGGLPAVTVCVTIATGITGAVIGPYILDILGINRPNARGIALGAVSHGIGTARAFNESEITGCWATVAMCLGSLLTALICAVLPALL
ncbi:MAG: LrgB family protein [Chitinophagales bacterium]|nr:LrgB family protein [Hyphomicrobiales bacterium]